MWLWICLVELYIPLKTRLLYMHKFQLLFQNSAWFILDQTLNHREFFRIFVKFQFCGGEFVCPCAFFGMENSQWIYLNHCHQFSVMVEHSEKILLSSARSNMTFFVSI